MRLDAVTIDGGDARLINTEQLTSGPAISSPLASTWAPSYRDMTLTNTNRKTDADGFTVVTNKKKTISTMYRNARGTLQNTKRIQAVEQIADIYVSRTKKHITEDDIKGHINDMGEEAVNVQLLKPKKETNFKSNKILGEGLLAAGPGFSSVQE